MIKQSAILLTSALLTAAFLAVPVLAQSTDRLSNNPTIDGTDINHPAITTTSNQITTPTNFSYLWFILPVIILGIVSYAIYAQMNDATTKGPDYQDFLDKYRDHYASHLNIAGLKGGEINRQSPQEIAHEQQMRDYERRLQELYNENDPLEDKS